MIDLQVVLNLCARFIECPNRLVLCRAIHDPAQKQFFAIEESVNGISSLLERAEAAASELEAFV